MFITGLGTAVPPTRYTQPECWAAINATPHLAALSRRSRALVRAVLMSQKGVETRHLALASLDEAFDLSPDAMLARFARAAPELGEMAARRALADAGLEVGDLGGLVVATCTGYLCPGLSSYVGERLGLARGAQLLDLVGLGCGAAIPALRTAKALLGEERHVLSVCVEVCSAAFYLDDDPGVLISACLFGDGAAAAVCSREPLAGRRAVRWVSGHSLHAPAQREKLRFEHRGGLLRNILAPEVPTLAAGFAGSVFETCGVARSQIAEWLLHAGGRDVLREVATSLELDDRQIRHTAAVLRAHGNMSSPSCLFALRRALDEPAPAGHWWLASFGAGFSSHGALLEVA